jgi:predicted RNA-binding Zn ribbon-like protein
MTTPLLGHHWTFELLGGRLCLDFANSVSGFRGGDDERDRLHGYADLVDWACQAGALDEPQAAPLLAEAARHPTRAVAAFADALALREAIFQGFLALARGKELPAPILARVDAAVRIAQAHRRLVRAGACCAVAWDFGTDLAAPTWPVALSAADLLTTPDDLSRLRLCGLHQTGECGWLFIDETRAGTRRWCSMRDCGNRAKARRHAARARTPGPQQPTRARPR